MNWRSSQTVSPWPRFVAAPKPARVGWRSPSPNGSLRMWYGVKPPSMLATIGVLAEKPVLEANAVATFEVSAGARNTPVPHRSTVFGAAVQAKPRRGEKFRAFHRQTCRFDGVAKTRPPCRSGNWLLRAGDARYGSK